MKKIALIIGVLLFTVGAFAQRTITGTVTDESGETLISVNVVVKGSTIGTITDLDGKYKISVPDDGSNILVFSYTGFTTQEMPLGASNVIDVVISEGILLNDVVVTALGISRDEKAVGYAVQQVDGADIAETNSVNFLDGLAGKAAGVQITQASGAAGASSRIVLRGQTSFNGNNEALIVVDGIRLDNSENSSERSLGGVANSNRGMDLDPGSIESISVLKGAAATALYGVEGARGVILITTKKGKKGKMTVDFNSNVTLAQYNKLVDRQLTYGQGSGGQIINPGTSGFNTALSFGARIDDTNYDGSDFAFDPRGRIVGKDDPSAGAQAQAFDNADNFFQNGLTYNNSIALSGGSDFGTYRFSFANTSQEGIIPLNTFDRTNVGLSVSSQFDKFSISGSVNYVNSGGRRIQQGSNTSGIMLGLMRTPASFDNAGGFDDPVNSPGAYQFPNGLQRAYRGNTGYDNPYWTVNNTPFIDNVNRMFGNVRLGYEFSPWATLSTTLGTDFYSDNRKQEFERGSNAARAGRVIEDQYNYSHIDAYVNLTGSGKLSPDFSLSYNVGTNFWNKQLKNNFVQADNLSFSGFRELANTSSVVASVDQAPERNFSMFGSVDLGYKNFLYLTLTGRNDWVSSLIVPTREFNAGDIDIFYPSASLSFVFSELLPSSDILSFGKARISLAQVGGGAPAAFSTGTIYNVPNNDQSIYSLNDGWTSGILFPFLGTTGYTYSPLQGNLDLTPSLTTDLEFGLDLRFFKNRIGLDATYYSRSSSNQIIAINVPNSTGFQRAIVNAGELGTTGTEVILNLTPIQTDNFSWDLGINFSSWETLVKSLPEGVQNQYLDGFAGTGVYNLAPDDDGTEYEYGQILGNPFQRVNDIDAAGNPVFNADAPFNPDGALIIDNSGDPGTNPNYGFPIADDVPRVIGNPNPDFLLGINSTIRWKKLTVKFLFDIKQGGDLWNGTKGAMTFFGTSANTEDRGKTETFEGVLSSDPSTAANIPVVIDENWYTGNGGGFGAVSEHFVEDGSSYRLRFLTASYNFGSLINGVSDLTLSFTGRNLLLFTPYTGIDPETSLVGSSSNGQGLDYFQMPGVKSYSLGLSVKF
jgi:TonB-linked SusC/RagA family outer membrane protein